MDKVERVMDVDELEILKQLEEQRKVMAAQRAARLIRTVPKEEDNTLSKLKSELNDLLLELDKLIRE